MTMLPSRPLSSTNLNQVMLSVQHGMSKIGDSVDISTTVRGLLPKSKSNTTLPNLSAPLSDGVRSLIKRSTSFSSAKQRRMHSQITNIFCSEMVGWDSILAEFQQALKDPTVTKLEIEDLLSSPCHHDLMAVAGKLVFAKDRTWEVLRFLDSFEANDFDTWKAKKDSIMRDYERCWNHLPDGTKTKSVTSFKAIVAIPKGTLVPDMVKLLKMIKSDKDVVEMILYGDQGAQLEHDELTKVVDADSALLKNTLSMELECRWKEPTTNYKFYINNCIYRLQHRHKLQVELVQEGILEPHCAAPVAPKRRTAFNTQARPGESSLQAMRRSIEGTGNTKLPVGRRSAPERRTPRKALHRSVSDSGDVIPTRKRGVTRSTSDSGDVLDPRTARRKGSSRSLQRTLSDSGDVLPKSMLRSDRSSLQRKLSDAASPRRRPRRSSKAEDRDPEAGSASPRRRPRRSSKTEDKEIVADSNAALRRTMSDSGDAPRRKPRRNLSKKSLSMDDEAQPQSRPLRKGRRSSEEENTIVGLQRALSDCGDADKRRRPRKCTSMQDAEAAARKERAKAKLATFQRSSTTPVPTRTKVIPPMSSDYEDTASEYSLDMESESDSDDECEDELEAMQLKELQILTSTGSNMSMKDLVALRKTLDAAIASIQTTPESYYNWWEEDAKLPAVGNSKDSGEGPDYDWELGVYCCRRTKGPPRAA